MKKLIAFCLCIAFMVAVSGYSNASPPGVKQTVKTELSVKNFCPAVQVADVQFSCEVMPPGFISVNYTSFEASTFTSNYSLLPAATVGDGNFCSNVDKPNCIYSFPEVMCRSGVINSISYCGVTTEVNCGCYKNQNNTYNGCPVLAWC